MLFTEEVSSALRFGQSVYQNVVAEARRCVRKVGDTISWFSVFEGGSRVRRELR